MSPRTLVTAFKNDAIADNAEFVHLISLNFSGGTTFLCTGAHDILWNSSTWVAVGGNLVLGNVEESGDTSGQGVELALSGVDQTILSALLTNDYRGRVCQVYRAHLNPTNGTVIADPWLMFEGLQLSAFEVEEERSREGGTVTIKTRIKGRMGIDRIRGIFSNVISHQHYFATDTFWQNAAPAAVSTIQWGTGAVNPGGGPGQNNPGEARPS